MTVGLTGFSRGILIISLRVIISPESLEISLIRLFRNAVLERSASGSRTGWWRSAWCVWRRALNRVSNVQALGAPALKWLIDFEAAVAFETLEQLR